MLIEILDPNFNEGILHVIGTNGKSYYSQTLGFQTECHAYMEPTIEFTIKIPVEALNAD